MQCPKCGTENRDNARFCSRCGTTFPVAPSAAPSHVGGPVGRAQSCPVCHAPLKPGVRFCASCGSPVPQPAASSPSSRDVPIPVVSSPPPTQMAAPQMSPFEDVPQAYTPSQARTPSQAPSLLDVEPAPVRGGARKRGRFAWVFALLGLLLSGCCVFSIVLSLSVGSAFEGAVAPPPEADPARPDLTISVSESYISSMIGDTLPSGLAGETTMDVKPDNLILMTSNFRVVIMNLEVIVAARLSVVDHRFHIVVEDVNAGGADIFELLGMDEYTLGDDMVDMVQDVLEKELGPGSELLNIRTDERWIILETRWN